MPASHPNLELKNHFGVKKEWIFDSSQHVVIRTDTFFDFQLLIFVLIHFLLWYISGFELVKQNRFAKIYKRNKEKGLPKIFFGFVNLFMKNVKGSNPLGTNITKWSNAVKQSVGKLPTNCLSMFDHFVGLALKGLTKFWRLIC